jgi:hypothetical protein
LLSESLVNGIKLEIVDDSAGLAQVENLHPKSQVGPLEATTVVKEEKGGSSPGDPADLENATPNVEALLATAPETTAAPEPPRKKVKRSKAAFGASPWPEHLHPTPEECAEVNRLLTVAHGPSTRPEKLVVNSEYSLVLTLVYSALIG